MNDELKQWTLYVLQLEYDKWYVGITTKSPQKRFEEHILQKRGAYWTMKYKPIKISATKELGNITKNEAEALENKTTRVLMKQKGLNNVRGGDLRDVDVYTNRLGWIWKKSDYADMKMFFIAGAFLFFVSFYIVWLQLTHHDFLSICSL